jgi:hypothetical protein
MHGPSTAELGAAAKMRRFSTAFAPRRTVRALRCIGLVALVGTPGCAVTLPESAHGAEIQVSFRTDDAHVRFEYFQHHVPGRHGGHDRYGTICAGPCDTVVHDWSRFRVDGDGIPASSSFYLQEGPPVRLRVHEGSAFANGLGIVLAALGGETLLPSTFVAVVSPDFRPGATLAALSSLAALAVGTLLWLLTRTTVEADPTSAIVR